MNEVYTKHPKNPNNNDGEGKVKMEKRLKYAIVGDKLKKLVERSRQYKERFLVNRVKKWLNKHDLDHVLSIYGLRRTGKTVIIHQVIDALLKEEKKVAYLLLDEQSALCDVYNDLDILYDNGFEYIFIDEITYCYGFLQSCNRLSDYYATLGMHIVIAGADSYVLALAGRNLLYNRMDRISTTYMGYKEYSYLIDNTLFFDYMKQGGILSKNGFQDIEIANDYINTSIVNNIINSLESADNRKLYAELYELDERGLLRKVIESIVEGANEKLLLHVITKLYKNHELGSTTEKLADVYNYHDELNTNTITDMYRYMLGIVKNDDSEFCEEYIEQVFQFLIDINVFTQYKRLVNNKYHDVFLYTQPGLRYYQSTVLLNALKVDDSFMKLDVQYRELFLKKVREGIEEDIIEHIVLATCLREVRNSNTNVTQLTCNYGEWDMVIYEEDSGVMDIYEIKRSFEQDNRQYNWLVDSDMQEYGEKILGTRVRRRFVLYNGETTTVTINGIEIEYINIDKFLKSLNYIG